MGDSYCNPFGDIKGTSKLEIKLKEEFMPNWLKSENYFAYEQFINVFSHISHILEDIFDKEIKLISAKLNNLGEGIIICELGDVPLSISLCRGTE